MELSTENLIYISQDLGCIFRVKDGYIEFAPICSNGVVDLDEFTEVDTELVGDEVVTFENKEITLKEVYAILINKLESIKV